MISKPPLKSAPQDWRFLMAIFSASVFLEMLAWGHMLSFAPLYLRDVLGVSPSDVPRWAGILASSSLAIAVPLSPFWGVLADRYSRKAIMLRALTVETAGYLLASICGDVWQLLAVRLLLGFAFGNVAIVIATQSVATPDRHVGTAVGIIAMAQTIAASVGPLFGSLLINTLGLRAMFAVDAGMTLLAGLVLLVGFKEPTHHDVTTPVLDRLKTALRQVTRVPAIRWNFLGWFMVYAGIGAMDPFVPVLIDRLAGGVDSATLIGGLLGAYGMLLALTTPIAGRFSDRVGSERLFLIATPILAVIAACIGIAWSIPLLGGLMMVRAISQAGTGVVLYAHLAKHVPAGQRAVVMSLTPMSRNAAWLIAPGAAAAATGFGLSAVFWLAAVFFAGATVAAVLMYRASGRVAVSTH